MLGLHSRTRCGWWCWTGPAGGCVGFEMNALTSGHCAVAAQAVSGGAVRSWPDVSLGRSFQCGIFVWLVFVPPSYLPPLLPSLPPSLFCPMLCASHRLYCSRVQRRTEKRQLGPERRSEEGGSGSACTARRPGPRAAASHLHGKRETQGHVDPCASRTGENTTKAILEEVEERKMNFLFAIY